MGDTRRDLGELYRELCEAPSDINEHLPSLVAMVRRIKATRVLELGVRHGVSTVAWLYALSEAGGHLWSVDKDFPNDDAPVRTLGPEDLSTWTFILGRDDAPRTLSALPRQVDIVFIDTSHTLAHTELELGLYAPRVRKGGLIILHDTLENAVEPGYPVRTAIEQFVASRGGIKWTDYPFNNGLGVIEV